LKFISLAFFCIIFLTELSAQENRLSSNKEPKIEVKLLVPSDTLQLSKPFPLKLEVTNSTKAALFVPKNIWFSSSLFPNGQDNFLVDGAQVYLEIIPTSAWSSIYIEGVASLVHVKFIKLKPERNQTFSLIDLSSHINAYMNYQELDPYLIFNTNCWYTCRIVYSNIEYQHPKYPNRTFIGKVYSNEVEIYVQN
jgi:hypothetical protein